MANKLHQGFFRITPYNPYVPLTDSFYMVENDNSFQLFKGNNVVATYGGFSRGIGKVLSAFNTEYCVYENGSGIVRCIDNNGNGFALTVYDSTIKSMFCSRNKIYIVRVVNSVLKVTEYIIVGATTNPFLEQTNEKTMPMPTGQRGEIYAAIKINENSAYCYRYLTGTASEHNLHTYWVKVNISENDFSLQTLIDEFPEITALQTLSANNTGFEFYNPLPLAAFISVSLVSGSDYRALIRVFKNGTQIAEYTIPVSGYNAVPGAAKVFFDTDNSGNGYALVGSMNTTPAMVMSVYRLQNGSYSLVATATSGQITAVRPAGVLGQVNGYYPWYGRFCGYPYGTNSYISYKANATLSGISLANANLITNTSNPDIRFGNTIKWIG